MDQSGSPPTGSAPATQAALKVARGPLRPRRLTSIRNRLSGRLIVQTFRLMDQALMGVIALALLVAASPTREYDARLALAAPVLAGSVGAIWMVRRLGGYRFGAREGLGFHLMRITGAVAAAGALARFLAQGLGPQAVQTAEVWTALALGGLIILHAGDWLYVQRARRLGQLTPNIVVVGATETAGRLIEQALEGRHLNVLGVFDDRADRTVSDLYGVPLLGQLDSLMSHKVLPFVDRIVIALPAEAEARVSQLVDRLRPLPNPVTLFVDIKGDSARQAFGRLVDAPLSEQGATALDTSGALSKRALDIVLAFLGLVFCAPVLLFLGLAVALESPGPVLFRQLRHGFNNEPITVLKFRSMRHDQSDPTASRQIRPDDERVTRVGRFIRRTSLDELPQLLNVLTGEMSLVGPRPHAIGMKSGGSETARLVAEYAWRHRMKPGITGWAQINGSRGPIETPEAVQERVRLDIEYIERQNFWFDLYILLLTVPRLLGDNRSVR